MLFFSIYFKPNHEHSLHVTPLPKKMAFYDANADGQISIKEFARTLGHDPRAFHVKDAFRVADANGSTIVQPLISLDLMKHIFSMKIYEIKEIITSAVYETTMLKYSYLCIYL